MRLYCKIKDEVLDFNTCLECSKQAYECPVTYEYINFLYEEEKERTNSLSITKLLSCPRKAFLLTKADYTQDVLDLYYAFRGSLTHLLLEKYKSKNCIVETMFQKDYNGITITGKPDKIDIENECIYDFKTITGKIGDDKSLRWGSARKKDAIQLNLYYWLVKDLFKISKLIVVYFGTDYPLKKEVKILEENDKKYKDIKECFEKAELLAKVWDKEIEAVKDIKYVKTWECDGYCPVKDICKSYL